MTFLQPIFLVLLIVVILPWWIGRQDWRHACLRSAALLLLVLALARPATLRQDEDRAYHIYVHDADPAASLWVETRRRHAAGNDEMREVLMSGSLSEALDQALNHIPQGSRGSITLVSNGLSTDEHWGQAIRQMQERNIPLHSITLPEDTPPGLRLLSLTETQPLRVGQAANLHAALLGVPAAQEITLTDVETETVLATHTPGEAAGRLHLALEIEPSRAGFLRLALQAGDQTLERTFAVEEPLQTLYLGERVHNSEAALQRLLGPGVALTPVSGPLPELDNYDLVILDDLPADRLPDTEQSKLLSHIAEHGLGLVMTGGMAAFGPGGYDDKPLADALPVEFMQKEEKRDPSTTLAIIIDTSGSMGGERVQLAKEVARLAIRRLLPHDKVGIVEFYGTKQWAAPIQSAANAIDIQRALNRLDAGGGTVIMPAIEEAYYAMQNVQTRYKHVLVLTDGGVEAGEFEPLLRKMAAKGMNVSTVLVGGDTHSEFLVNLANWGKGHFYSASNRFSIPEILLKQPSTSKIPAYRPGEHAVTGRGGPGWWGSVRSTSVPALAGYVETRAREEAEVLLETTAKQHPILTTWKFGLGRVTTLTTEPAGGGTASWATWEDYGPWLARIVARTAREERQPFAFTTTREKHEITVRAEKLVDEEIFPLVERLGDEGRPLVMRRRSPAVFTAKLMVDPGQEMRFLGSTADEGTLRPKSPFVSNARDDITPEERLDPQQMIDRQRLAAATQGRHLALADAGDFVPEAGGGPYSLRVVPLWNLCLLLALLCYLADVVYRRWPTRERA